MRTVIKILLIFIAVSIASTLLINHFNITAPATLKYLSNALFVWCIVPCLICSGEKCSLRALAELLDVCVSIYLMIISRVTKSKDISIELDSHHSFNIFQGNFTLIVRTLSFCRKSTASFCCKIK